MKKWLLCLALFAAWSISAAVILENGELNAEIIIPSDANVVEKYAARELAEHLQLVSGKNVPVLTVAGGKRHQIRLGRAAKLDIARVAENSALVKIGKDSIDIAGRDGNGNPMTESVSVGTLFGVYEFIERFLGVRWYTPGTFGECFEKLAKVETSALPIDQTPAY